MGTEYWLVDLGGKTALNIGKIYGRMTPAGHRFMDEEEWHDELQIPVSPTLTAEGAEPLLDFWSKEPILEWLREHGSAFIASEYMFSPIEFVPEMAEHPWRVKEGWTAETIYEEDYWMPK